VVRDQLLPAHIEHVLLASEPSHLLLKRATGAPASLNSSSPRRCTLFVGRGYDMLKILGWDRNGYAIWSKKIESDEKFRWPRMLDEAVITLTAEQLNWLLDGYDVWSAPHRMIRFTHVS
jgi:hypothetical protein